MTSSGCRCRNGAGQLKAKFPTERRAKAAIRGIKRDGERREHQPQRAYPCPSGKGWHLTSQA